VRSRAAARPATKSRNTCSAAWSMSPLRLRGPHPGRHRVGSGCPTGRLLRGLAVTWSNGSMGDDLEQRLSAAAETLREYELTRQRDTELQQRLVQETGRVATLREEAAREADDVARLEGLTLTRVMASLRGARDDRLARERAEADAARYRLQHAEARLAALRAEHEAARARLAALSDAPAAYAAVLDEKERYLRQAGGPTGRRLLEL